MSGQLRFPRSCQNCDAESICPAYPIAGGCDAFVSSNGAKSRIVVMTTAQSESIDRQANPLHTHAAVAPAERARTCGECASFEVCRSMPVGRDEKADLLRSTPACTLFRAPVLQTSLPKSPTCTESQTGGKAAPVAAAAREVVATDFSNSGFGKPAAGGAEPSISDLVPVSGRSVGGEVVQTVNARELHTYMKIGKVFGAWISERIEQYGFVEGVDFTVTVSKVGIRQNVTQKDYFISLDMAKELSMVERNAKGKEARRYFIACERKLKEETAAPAPAAFRIPRSLPEALRMAAEQAERAEAAEALAAERANVIVKQAPKVIACDILSEAEGERGIRDAAKELGVPERRLIEAMIDKRWLYRSTDGRRSLKPMAEISKLGFARLVPVPDADGEKTHDHLKITNAGLTRLAALVVRWGLLQDSGMQRRICDAGGAA